MKSNPTNKTILVLSIFAFWVYGDSYATMSLLIDIADDLNISFHEAAYSVTAYLIFFGFFTLIFGPLADRFGKSKIIKIAALATAIFSILAAFSMSLEYLIITRAINGIFAAAIIPVSIALAGETVRDKSQIQNAIGKIMALMFLGGASANVIGGVLTYLGSWRLVYGLYGVVELILAFIILSVLEKTEAKMNTLSFSKVYKQAFQNKSLMKVISIMFLIGFAILGSFSYSSKLIQTLSDYNSLLIGLIISLFGFGTVIGGKKAAVIKKKTGTRLLLFAGILGGLSLGILSFSESIILAALALFTLGLSFILIQSTLVATAQGIMPQLRGTVMSLASFNMVMSGGIATYVNGLILTHFNIGLIYLIASFLIFLVGLRANSVVPSLDSRKDLATGTEQAI